MNIKEIGAITTVVMDVVMRDKMVVTTIVEMTDKIMAINTIAIKQTFDK